MCVCVSCAVSLIAARVVVVDKEQGVVLASLGCIMPFHSLKSCFSLTKSELPFSPVCSHCRIKAEVDRKERERQAGLTGANASSSGHSSSSSKAGKQNGHSNSQSSNSAGETKSSSSLGLGGDGTRACHAVCGLALSLFLLPNGLESTAKAPRLSSHCLSWITLHRLSSLPLPCACWLSADASMSLASDGGLDADDDDNPMSDRGSRWHQCRTLLFREQLWQVVDQENLPVSAVEQGSQCYWLNCEIYWIGYTNRMFVLLAVGVGAAAAVPLGSRTRRLPPDR